MKLVRRLRSVWTRFWMNQAGISGFGRLATRLAGWRVAPYKGRISLARQYVRGYVSPSATISHPDVRLGSHVYIGDRVIIFGEGTVGPVQLGDRVLLCAETIIEAGRGGSVLIGADTGIQPRCQLTAYLAPIEIGRGVQIAPYCAFYPYDHGTAPGELIRRQPLESNGGIVIEDDAWLGTGVTVLSGVRIGKGAVIGAGAVVTHDIPAGAVAAGIPARVIRMRGEAPQ